MKVVQVVALGATAALSLSIVGCSSSSTSTSTPPASSASTTPATTDVADPTTTTSASIDIAATTAPADTVSDTTAPIPPSSSSTSTTVDDRPVDLTDQTLALAAMLHAEDFGASWTVYSPAQAFRVSPESCAYEADGAVTRISNGGAQSGPNMQLGATGAFVGSFALALPDEASALEYIALVNGDPWGACRAGQLQQVQDGAGADYTIALVTREESTLNQNGFESYALFSVAAPDGAVSRYVAFSFYRIGRVVIVTTLENGSLSDADTAAFQDEAYNALVAAYARVGAL